ncbi:MAG: alpha/beta hydrolase [Chloroflexota bacterium]
MHDPMLEHHQTTLRSGAQVHYISGGPDDGIPIVLLHGGGTDHALLSWRDTLPVLVENGYRVYAPNYPGYGPSPLDTQPSTTDVLIGYLEQLMDAWQIDRTALVGISMGASIAIGYTLRHPERVRGLTLIGAYGIQDDVAYHRLSYLFLNTPWLVDASWKLMRGSRWAARYSLNSIVRNPAAQTEALIDEVMVAMNNVSAQQAFSQWQRDEVRWGWLKTNYTERLHEIAAPVLLVHGTHDAGVPLKYAQRAATKFQDARLEVFEHAGHWTQRDFPERFHTLLLAFLENRLT